TSPERELEWQDDSVKGVHSFLGRVYRFVMRHGNPEKREGHDFSRAESSPNVDRGALAPAARNLQRKLHQTIKRVSDDFSGRWHFNTCIAAVMEYSNALYGVAGENDAAWHELPASLRRELLRNLVLLLAPFAPYMAHELWATLGETSNLLRAPWPEYDAALAKEDEVEIPVQVNGKIRSRLLVPMDSAENDVRDRALAD